MLSAQIPVLSWWALATVITRTATTLTMLAILVLGVYFYVHGTTTVGEIVMFMSFATLLIGKLEQAVHFANRMVMDAPRVAEFFEVLDTEPAVRDRPDAVDPGRLRGLVEFKDVSFSYDGKRPAVADLTFTALPGETIALVGATGAGKSTALALLHRVFDPQSGAVKIDGMDIRGAHADGPAPQYRRGVPGGAAVQPLDRREPAGRQARRDRGGDAGGLRARAGPRRDRAPARKASRPAPASADGCSRAASASGSSIARALLKDPPILILDEATSALDALTEAKVQAALAEVMKGRTTFVIAHRLATIRNASRILVFRAAASSRPAASTSWCGSAAISPSSPGASSWRPRARRYDWSRQAGLTGRAERLATENGPTRVSPGRRKRTRETEGSYLIRSRMLT